MFIHQHGKKCIVRRLSCIDNGRVFLELTATEKRAFAAENNVSNVIQVEKITKPEDTIWVDPVDMKVYIYSK